MVGKTGPPHLFHGVVGRLDIAKVLRTFPSSSDRPDCTSRTLYPTSPRCQPRSTQLDRSGTSVCTAPGTLRTFARSRSSRGARLWSALVTREVLVFGRYVGFGLGGGSGGG